MNISVCSKEESDMRKMRTPEIDVIRFTESDIVAASGGKFITIAGLGDPDTVSAKFTMGANTWDSKTVVDAQSSGVETMMDEYSGGKTNGYIYGDYEQIQVFDLASADLYWYDNSQQYSAFNGTYEWNGNIFLKKK